MSDMYVKVSRLITYGIAISLVLLATGTVLLVANGGAPGVKINPRGSIPMALNTSSYTLATSVAEPSGITLIYAGLFVLVSIPVLIVFALTLSFFREGSRIYMALGLIVLADLLVAILLLPAIMH